MRMLIRESVCLKTLRGIRRGINRQILMACQPCFTHPYPHSPDVRGRKWQDYSPVSVVAQGVAGVIVVCHSNFLFSISGLGVQVDALGWPSSLSAACLFCHHGLFDRHLPNSTTGAFLPHRCWKTPTRLCSWRWPQRPWASSSSRGPPGRPTSWTRR